MRNLHTQTTISPSFFEDGCLHRPEHQKECAGCCYNITRDGFICCSYAGHAGHMLMPTQRGICTQDSGQTAVHIVLH